MEVESGWSAHLVFRLTHDISQKNIGFSQKNRGSFIKVSEDGVMVRRKVPKREKKKLNPGKIPQSRGEVAVAMAKSHGDEKNNNDGMSNISMAGAPPHHTHGYGRGRGRGGHRHGHGRGRGEPRGMSIARNGLSNGRAGMRNGLSHGRGTGRGRGRGAPVMASARNGSSHGRGRGRGARVMAGAQFDNGNPLTNEQLKKEMYVLFRFFFIFCEFFFHFL